MHEKMNPPRKIISSGFDTMGLLLAVWICTLPFIGLLIAPLFGVQTAATIAVALLIVMLIICWGSCIPMAVREYRKWKSRRSSSSSLLELNGGNDE